MLNDIARDIAGTPSYRQRGSIHPTKGSQVRIYSRFGRRACDFRDWIELQGAAILALTLNVLQKAADESVRPTTFCIANDGDVALGPSDCHVESPSVGEKAYFFACSTMKRSGCNLKRSKEVGRMEAELGNETWFQHMKWRVHRPKHCVCIVAQDSFPQQKEKTSRIILNAQREHPSHQLTMPHQPTLSTPTHAIAISITHRHCCEPDSERWPPFLPPGNRPRIAPLLRGMSGEVDASVNSPFMKRLQQR